MKRGHELSRHVQPAKEAGTRDRAKIEFNFMRNVIGILCALSCLESPPFLGRRVVLVCPGAPIPTHKHTHNNQVSSLFNCTRLVNV